MQRVQIRPHDTLVRVWSVVHELEDGSSLALFDERQNELLVLNGAASAAWELIDGRRSVAAIAGEILEILGPVCPVDQLHSDLLALFETLFERGGLVLRES